MDVDAMSWRQIQNDLGEDAPKGCHHDEIRFPRGQGIPQARVFHFEGLEDRNLVSRGELLDGRFGEFLSASLRSVRLRDHTDHGVIRTQQRCE